MSRNRTRLGFLLAALMLLFISVKPAVAQDDYGGDIDYQQFYDELSPYGQWVDDPDYGYVWVPDAGDDFRPYYSNGYWAYTDYGNTWVSDYNWGWAPFHYGRWTYNNYYGWMWIPGNTWGPAWVSWRGGGSNYGWAPLGPGISVNIAIGGYSCPDYWWNFIPQQQIFSRNWNRYSYGPRYNNTYINQTTIINNTYIVNRNTYLGGPRRDDLRRATGQDPRPLAVNDSRNPQRARVRGNSLNIYRPAVSSTRPDNNMRPRQFRQAERPIRGNTPNSAAGFGSRQGTTPMRQDGGNNGTVPGRGLGQQPGGSGFDRGQTRPDPRNRNGVQSPATVTPDRNDRNVPAQPGADPRRFNQDRPQRQQADPRFETAPQQQQAQPGGFDRPQRQPRFEQAPQQQPQQPRFETAPQQQPRGFDRPQASPRSFEQPRQQVQPQQQRSFEQPRAVPQQQPMNRPGAVPQQRMEQPRAMPQQQAPRAMPQQQAPGGFGGQREGRMGR